MLAHNPRIITDSLVLYLDAANTKSYPGTGTVIYDLSGNSRTGTFNTNTQYDGASKSLYFPESANQRMTIAAGGTGSYISGVTLEFWIKPLTSTSGVGGLFEKSNNGTPHNRLYIGSNSFLGHQKYAGYATTNSSSTIVLSTWQCWVMCYYNNAGTANTTYYKNGVFQNTAVENNAYGSGDNTYEYGNVNGASYLGTIQGDAYPYKGYIQIVRQYNKILSAAEVLQNFNALKSRYI